MAIVSTGQITIVDYFDAVSLTSFVASNQALTQTYNPDNATYSPNYATSNLILTPSLFKAGSGVDEITSAQVKSIKWYDGVTEIVAGTNYGLPAFATGTNRPLTVKANILSGSTVSKTFVCEIIYTDAGTGLDVTVKSSITISRINNGGGVTMAQVTSPDGNVFKNGSGSLKAKGELLRSSGVDTTSIVYEWFVQDASQSTDVGGGIGWKKIDATYNLGITGYTTTEITIPSSAVSGLETFKVRIKDGDSASPTYNQYFTATLTFVDQTDPIQAVVQSTGGDVLKNGVGSTTLTAKLFQAGQEVDSAGTTYNYKWYKYNSAGTLVTDWGGTGINYKTGKSITVGSADVDVKATFMIDIETK